MKIVQNVQLFILSSILCSNLAYSKIITDYDETIAQVPFALSNEESLLNTICKTRDHLRWDVCFTRFEDDQDQMKSFKFTNEGVNDIVTSSGFMIGRQFEFMFEGFARSDLGLLIWDMPDERESHGHLKLMMFFPRLVMPAIRYVSDAQKDQLIVTLPTKEEVIFNGKTREVLGGVFLEGPMKQDMEGNAINPEVKYTGKGVVIEADKINDYPVGLLAQTKDNFATIKKNGHPDCKVSVKELWYTDDKKGGNVFFNKKYVTDAAFETFLKQRCKFSMY